MTRVAVVVQARTGSTRLPGKVLLPVAGAPILQRMLERVRAATTPFELVLATTREADDDVVAALGRQMGVRVVRGHSTDLLHRHVQAARSAQADVVVKIPSDCPLVDPDAIDLVLATFLRAAGSLDFVSNLHPATWPDGHDVEAMTTAALEDAWREAKKPYEREHTTPFLWDQPERFRCANVAHPSGTDRSRSHRMTLDYPEDYAFVRAVYDALYSVERPIFSLADVLALLAERPDVHALNAAYAGVNWYRHHLADLRTVRAEETRCPPTC